MRKRVEWVDIAKGIAIICVVLGHAGNAIAADFVYMFHLSVFIFMSGYFYNAEFTEKPFRIFPKRIKKLYLMYFVYEMIFLLARPVFFMIGWYQDGALYSGNTVALMGISGIIKESIKILVGMGREPLIGAMWFVIMLIMIQIMYAFMKAVLYRLHLEKFDTVCIILLFIFACIVTRVGIYIPRFSPAVFGLIFYHLGFCLKKYEDQHEVPKINALIPAALCVALLGGSILLPIGYSEKIATYPLWFLLTSIVGIFCVVWLAKKIDAKGLVGRFIKVLGVYSFDIMALHFCAFKFVSMIIIGVYGLDKNQIVEFPIMKGYSEWAVLYTIIGILLPIPFGWIRVQLQKRLRREK